MLKKINLEVFRIFCAICVIYGHTWTNGMYLFSTYDKNSFYFWLYSAFSTSLMFIIPVFFMISGALLLSKDYSFKDLYVKKILRYFIIFVFCGVIYLYFYSKTPIVYNAFNFSNILDYFFRRKVLGHMLFFWFLPSYIFFLILVPFLRCLAKNLDEKCFKYLIVLYLVYYNILLPIKYIFNLDLCYFMPFNETITMVVIYPLMGYYFENVFDINKIKGNKLILFISFILMFIFAGYITSLRYEGLDKEQPFLREIFAVFYIYLYLYLKRFCMSLKSEKVRNIICTLSSCTFGIYLFHQFPLTLLSPFIFSIPFNKMILAIFTSFVVYIISFIFVYILKKIPLVKFLFG